MADEAAAIEDILDQHRAAKDLAAAGLSPARSLLLSGPPGVGKTMSAYYIAGSLALPLVTVDLAGLMSSFLGRTGQNLRQALDYARSFQCVLLLDEFDALAKRRDDSSDVGELKRIVNVLLLELERWPTGNLLIAATNHPELLDRAVDRRFDVVIELSLPDVQTRAQILKRCVDDVDMAAEPGLLAACAVATAGWSGSDLKRLVQSASRRAVLSESSIGQNLIDAALEPLRAMSADSLDSRIAFCGLAADHLGLSQRTIGDMLGISHPTVGKLIQKWRRQRRPTIPRVKSSMAASG